MGGFCLLMKLNQRIPGKQSKKMSNLGPIIICCVKCNFSRFSPLGQLSLVVAMSIRPSVAVSVCLFPKRYLRHLNGPKITWSVSRPLIGHPSTPSLPYSHPPSLFPVKVKKISLSVSTTSRYYSRGFIGRISINWEEEDEEGVLTESRRAILLFLNTSSWY